MTVSFKRITDVLAVLFVIALIVLALPAFRDIQFELVNTASEPVAVTVLRGGDVIMRETIAAGSNQLFNAADGEAFVFKMVYANGQEIESDAFHFTNGVRVLATVSDQGISCRLVHDI